MIEDSKKPERPPPPPVLKLHYIYKILGVVAVSISLASLVLEAITLDTSFSSVQYALIPFVVLAGVVLAFFCDPRDESRTFVTVLWLLFGFGGELAGVQYQDE